MPPSKTKMAGTPSHNKRIKDTVGVYLRVRPLKVDEPSLKRISEQQVRTVPPDGSPHQVYSFTRVFDNAPQSEIFDKVARPVTERFITQAKDGLIFTYGISGSGKTYTMEGLKSDPGLIYRSIDFVFNSIGSQQTMRGLIQNNGKNTYCIQDYIYPDLARAETPSAIPSVVKWQNRTKETASVSVDPTAYYCLFISLIELYNKQVFDLLEDINSNTEKRRLEIRADDRGTSYVANVVEVEVKSADEAVEIYTRGVRRRKTNSTALNQESSRGHCVLNLKLVRVKKSYDDQFDEDTLEASQLCLVDLAGSERAKRSGATGGALHEACNINNSLGALRKCIRALRDNEPTAKIQYREYSLTRLFKSYFEGNGHVCMVLCVKPTAQDFYENKIAMDFGLLTQDVAMDYASPPKMLKRSKSRAQESQRIALSELLDRKLSQYEPNSDLADEEFMDNWIDRLKRNRDRKKKLIEATIGAQNEFRQTLLKMTDERDLWKKEMDLLRVESENRDKDIRGRDEQIKVLTSKLGSTERSYKNLKVENSETTRKTKDLDSTVNKLRREVEVLRERDREHIRILRQMGKAITYANTAPSAPEPEPLQSSSPVGLPNPSTTETTDSNTPATTTNSSSEEMDYQERATRSPVKSLLSSPTNRGVPVANPHHIRSLSCSNMRWIHHKPTGTIDTGTVLKPKIKNSRSIRNLRSSDILRKDTAGYSLVHQDADPNGDVETSVYKCDVISTVSGGAQVIIKNIETMKQESPVKRKRAASDAHYTH